jgi:hypothetical protein
MKQYTQFLSTIIQYYTTYSYHNTGAQLQQLQLYNEPKYINYLIQQPSIQWCYYYYYNFSHSKSIYNARTYVSIINSHTWP